MSVLNTFQYKQCVSCQNVIVYRPDEKNSRGANGLNEVSVNVKTKNAFKYDYFTVFLLSEKCIIYRSLKHRKRLKNLISPLRS